MLQPPHKGRSACGRAATPTLAAPPAFCADLDDEDRGLLTHLIGERQQQSAQTAPSYMNGKQDGISGREATISSTPWTSF